MKSKKEEKKVDREENEDYNSQEDIVVEEYSDIESIKKLRDKLKACTLEKQEYLNGWQRAKADFINYKKGEEERKTDLRKFLKEDLLLELLPILDSFYLSEGSQSWQDGLEQIFKQLMSVLKKEGLEEINPLNDDFNPNFHEAVEMIQGEDGKVLEVVSKGYMLNNKIIRPARVKVGKE